MKFKQGARAAGGHGARALPFWPPPKQGWLPIAGVSLIYAAHWLYGALVSDASLVMGAIAAMLVGAILIIPRLRDDLLRLTGLAPAAALFGLVVAAALLSLTPWTPGGAHPVWGYVGVAPGASTIDKSATIIEIIKLLGLACLFVVGLATGARDDRARYAIRLLLTAGVAFGLWAFLISVTGTTAQTQGRRLEAHFLNPNTAGTVFAILLVLALAELARRLRRQDGRRDVVRAAPAFAAALTFLVCLLDSASRGAMTAALGAMAVYIALQLATGRLKPSGAVGAALVGLLGLIVVVTLAGERLLDRLFQSHESSIVRSEIWKIHWQAFLNSTLFGYGLGAAETINKTLINGSNFDLLWNIRAILNAYVQWLEEAGLAGAIPMFLCIAWLIALTAKGLFRRNRLTGLLAGLLAVDAVVLIHGATDFGLEVPSVAGLWAWLLGLQVSLAQGSSQR